MKLARIVALVLVTGLIAGCGTQPITWTKNAPLDLTRGGKVAVNSACSVPQVHLDYLQTDIQKNVGKVLAGDPDSPDAYSINVTITKYDEGSAFARFMLIGLGQIYLYGTVEVNEGNPPVAVRQGDFKKNICIGGIAGASVSMDKSVLPTVGPSIAEAIKKK